MDIDDDLPWGIADVAVQELDDGFRQRRWLVAHYAACWNGVAAWTDATDPEVADESLAYHQDLLSAALQASSAVSSLADPVRFDGRLVAALAALKVVEAWIEAGNVEPIDMKMLRESAKADILENRPFAILEVLAYNAASPASGSAEWRRVTRADGYHVANFTTGDFFRWAADVSGFNERFVRAALAESGPIRKILEGERSTKGKKGSVFPEVLDALRDRGQARLKANPIRKLWAQGTVGTTIDEQVPAEQIILPFPGNWPKRGNTRSSQV